VRPLLRGIFAMKKAFTLIELLVVIAIIAILAAILFPVFAQAKAAAKKAASISNQKQISLGIIMYGGDNDDTYPRNDDCIVNSSLNGALNNVTTPTVNCAVPAGFAHRVNHFSWQKWTAPYVKNVQLYFNPARGNVNAATPSCPSGSWAQCGQVTGSYLLNTSITGQLNTWNRAPGSPTMFRNSWLGGSMTALPNTAATGILMESGNLQIGVVPIAYGTDSTSNSVTVFPPAVRELWRFELGKQIAAYPGVPMTAGIEADEARAAFQGIVVGHADGSAKFYTLGKFLAATPTAAEYGVAVTPAFGIQTAATSLRGFTGGTVGLGANPNLTINYPLWGLGQ
jgi:prepilin-type N-terminal cleavage/methylation domain-containing protein